MLDKEIAESLLAAVWVEFKPGLDVAVPIFPVVALHDGFEDGVTRFRGVDGVEVDAECGVEGVVLPFSI